MTRRIGLSKPRCRGSKSPAHRAISALRVRAEKGDPALAGQTTTKGCTYDTLSRLAARRLRAPDARRRALRPPPAPDPRRRRRPRHGRGDGLPRPAVEHLREGLG